MTRTVKGLQALSFILAVGLGLAQAAQAETLLRWTEGSADRGTRAQAYHWFADTVSKRSNGDVRFKFYFGGALMGHAANVSGIGSGTADIGQIIGAYNPKELLAYAVTDVPIVGIDAWVGMMAAYELATTNPTMQKMFDGLNLTYIANQSTGPVEMVCKKLDFKSLDDIKGAKLRGSGPFSPIMTSLGANVISLSQEDVYSALDTGLVSCNQQYIQGVIPYRQYEVTDQLILIDLGQIFAFGLVMNKDSYERLPEKDRKIIRETGREFIDHYGKLLYDAIDGDLAKMKKEGSEFHMTVTSLSDADKAKLSQAADAYVGTWIKQANAAGLPGQELREEFVRLVGKYDAIREQKGYPWAPK
ncbi:MAG: C4-dicarboxylate TRAP transporter substrate-binding protein [Burkholderiaceae bacterium]